MPLRPLALVVAAAASVAANTYVAAKVGSCSNKSTAYGIMHTTAAECTLMGGGYNPGPQDWELTACHLDWCTLGVLDSFEDKYVPAKVGACGDDKVAYGYITTTGSDCVQMGGNTSALTDAEWAACYLDWCALDEGNAFANTYVAAAVGACVGDKVGYGYIVVQAGECSAAGGEVIGTPASLDWSDCYLDWCARVAFNDSATPTVTAAWGSAATPASAPSELGGAAVIQTEGTAFGTASRSGSCTLTGAGVAPGPGGALRSGNSGGAHCWENINDGTHGNSYSWIADESAVELQYAGVFFGELRRVYGLGLSRDAAGAFADRSDGHLRIQAAFVNLSAEAELLGEADWVALGNLSNWATAGSIAWWSFVPPLNVFALRLSPSLLNNCVDEFVIAGAPLPPPAPPSAPPAPPSPPAAPPPPPSTPPSPPSAPPAPPSAPPAPPSTPPPPPSTPPPPPSTPPSPPAAPPAPPSSPPPLPPAAQITGDPHVRGAHGDAFDFRGVDDGIYVLLSTPRLSLAARFRHRTFFTPHSKLWVNGSWIVEAYWTVRTSANRTLRLPFFARRPRLDGSSRPRKATVGGVRLSFAGRRLSVSTPSWATHATAREWPHRGQHHLDVLVRPTFDVRRARVAPHGLLGQTYDDDGAPLHGVRDSYATLDDGTRTARRTKAGGRVTTRALGEGAIEGRAEMYRVKAPFDTAFAFSRFGVLSARPRNVTELRARRAG